MLTIASGRSVRRKVSRHFSAVSGLVAIAGYMLFAAVASASTHVTADINTNTTWTTAGSPYLLDKQVKVATGVTLTIQPGTTVEFNATQGLTFFVGGILKALGTESAPIKFTSSQGAAGEGVPGQYKGITVLGSSASAEFSFAEFEYGGYGTGGYYAYGELTTQSGATLKVDHSVFKHNAYSGLNLAGTGSTEVSYSSFVENGDGIAQSANAPGPFTLRHSTVSKNTQDGLYFNFLKEATFTGANIENNEISENKSAGIDIRAYCSSSKSGFPHGHGNDIDHNGSNPEVPSDGSEIYTLYRCEALSVDWTGNYWGAAEFIVSREPLLLKGFVCEGTVPKEWYEPASFQSLGYLAYSAYPKNALNPPPGPISTSSYTTFEPRICPDKTVASITIKHVYNSFYLAPGEIASEPIPIE